MPPTLATSYAYCERLARREAGNFYHAFRLLPLPQRRAMCALYAYMRVADDLSDGPEAIPDKRALLDDWRRQLALALAGSYGHPLYPALHDTVSTYGIPRQYLIDVLDGVYTDLEPVRYDTFADLYPYCYRVASAVGLCCIHIWGFERPEAKCLAETAGIAFQLTNILRDLAEDAARGRVYLPREDLDRFGYTEEQLRRGERDDNFRRLMRFEVERARSYYEAARPLAGLLRPAGRAVYLVMARTYRGLLDAIEKRDYDVFSERVRLSRWHKLWLALRALPVRWGIPTAS
ncbi:MAG TPA: phytoene/squalene synthase family protein [Gemmataceae bacterium]|nr:phytoene/squalene synthase family protein [Gemmataceae bacterium]